MQTKGLLKSFFSLFDVFSVKVTLFMCKILSVFSLKNSSIKFPLTARKPPLQNQQGGFLFRLVGQSLSTLVSTSLQYVSACGRCHSLTETVYFALLSFLGLISSFHNISPDFVFYLFLGDIAVSPTITILYYIAYR